MGVVNIENSAARPSRGTLSLEEPTSVRAAALTYAIRIKLQLPMFSTAQLGKAGQNCNA
ncbi:hypothetical protein E2320_014609 [Naja naja]|nr:hypothetical protein E2320_014609 [Naja naja]